MLPNKGVSQIKPGERHEPLWSPLIEPMSKEVHQKRMGITDEQEKEDDSQSSETDSVPTSAKIEYENRFLDF